MQACMLLPLANKVPDSTCPVKLSLIGPKSPYKSGTECPSWTSSALYVSPVEWASNQEEAHLNAEETLDQTVEYRNKT